MPNNARAGFFHTLLISAPEWCTEHCATPFHAFRDEKSKEKRKPPLFVLRKLKRQRERLCRFVYNQILTAECTQLNGTWPDPDDPRWSSGEYAELLPDWFPTNATNSSTFGNATTPSTLGNVIEIKLQSRDAPNVFYRKSFFFLTLPPLFFFFVFRPSFLSFFPIFLFQRIASPSHDVEFARGRVSLTEIYRTTPVESVTMSHVTHVALTCDLYVVR